VAHQPKPFYRSARAAWYVQLGKQQIKLLSGPDDTATEKLAWAEFHRLMAAGGNPPTYSANPPTRSGGTHLPVPGLTVAEVFEKYLDWCQKHRSPRTYEWTKKHVQMFCDHLPAVLAMPATQLRPFHLVEWVDSRPTWGANQKRGAIVAVQRPFSWAAKLGYIDRNPVAGVEKPKAVRRDVYLSADDFAALLSHYKEGDPFRELLVFSWETGCRPQEARHLEPRHYNPKFSRFDIPPEEAKGKRRWRVIRLTDVAREVVERRLQACNAKVFENEDGAAWTVDAVNCRFQRLKRSKGVAAFAYALRHGFCQRKLEEGHDHLTVAELMGHATGQMVATVYSHMNKADGHLQKALKKTAGA
jgi:integrase